MKTRLERLVKLGKISFEVPLITGSAVMTDVSVVNISSGGTFDFLCHPYTSSTSAKTTSPQSTRHVESSTSKSQWLWIFVNRSQLPVGLLAQLVEHCTCIAVVTDSNPVQAWIFSDLIFTALLLLRRSLSYSQVRLLKPMYLCKLW